MVVTGESGVSVTLIPSAQAGRWECRIARHLHGSCDSTLPAEDGGELHPRPFHFLETSD